VSQDRVEVFCNSLRVGRSRDRIPVEARFPAPVQHVPGTHPATRTMGIVFFLELKLYGSGVDDQHFIYRRG